MEYNPDSYTAGASFESKESFMRSFSKYSLNTKQFTASHSTGARFDMGKAGVPLSWRSEDGQVCIDSSDTHTLVIGSTGSKKSRLVAMPTVKLLGYGGESIIICDPKSEIYTRTAFELKCNGYDIIVVNFRHPNEGDAWNPLEIPYQFYFSGDVDKACEFANDIAINLMLSEASLQDPYWDLSASDMFFGLTLLLFKYCKEHNIRKDLVNMTNLLRLRQKLFVGEGRTDNLLWEYAKSDEIIQASLVGTVKAPDKTQASIISVFDAKMRCFVIQSNLLAMLSENNISLSKVGEKKTAIFLIMPDEKTSYHKLISLFIKQSYEYFIYLAQQRVNKTMPIRINYVLDEFSSLPPIKDFPSMITAARSRNIRFTLIVQSKHQLIQRYKEETDTIQSNCTNWIFITSRELKLLEEISTLCGTKSGNKPLISISALQHFDKDKGEVLVMSGRLKPIRTSLPDIDKYDRGVFKSLEFNNVIRQKIEPIDYSNLNSKYTSRLSKPRTSLYENVDPNSGLNNTNNGHDSPLAAALMRRKKELEGIRNQNTHANTTNGANSNEDDKK